MSASDFDVFSQQCDIVITCHDPLISGHSALHSNLPLLPIGGVPLIVRCIAPFVACGFRRFYIMHKDEKVLAVIRSSFPKSLVGDSPLQLVYIHHPNNLTQKETLRLVAEAREGFSKQHDVIVMECTTLLSKEDIIPFVTNFYSSFACGAMLLWKGYVPPESKAAQKKGGAKGKHNSAVAEVSPTDNLVLVALEDESPSGVSIGARSSDEPDAAHYRIHFAKSDASEIPALQMGFVARRPNLEFRYDLNDSGVYILQPWLFEAIIYEGADEGEYTVRDILYVATVKQHWYINRSSSSKLACPNTESISQLLGGNQNVHPPGHWVLKPQVLGPIARTPNLAYYGNGFNSMQDVVPNAWDNIRIVCTVITDTKNSGRRLIKISSASDLAIANADVSSGLHFQVANSTMQVHHPRAMCDTFFSQVLASYVDDLKYKRNATGQANFKNSIVLCDAKKNIGKSTFTDGSFIAETAVLGDKVSLLNCVVMDGAIVSNGSKLSHCIVSEGVTVPTDTTAKSEFFART